MRFRICLFLLLSITSIYGSTEEKIPPKNKQIDNDNNKPNNPIPKIISTNNLATKGNVNESKNTTPAHEGAKDNSASQAINNGTTALQNELQRVRGDANQFEMQSGALLRGFYVLLGVTLIVILYLGVRIFRLKHGSKPPTMVRKYGILASRGDVEMLPLPLSEDEEDDTVFELNNHINK